MVVVVELYVKSFYIGVRIVEPEERFSKNLLGGDGAALSTNANFDIVESGSCALVHYY